MRSIFAPLFPIESMPVGDQIAVRKKELEKLKQAAEEESDNIHHLE
jgi:hypothetical protein